MRRKEDTLEAKIMRMREFYTVSQLYDFKEVVVKHNYDWNEAMTYLDMQTRVNYVVTEKDPKMSEYIQMYLKWKYETQGVHT